MRPRRLLLVATLLTGIALAAGAQPGDEGGRAERGMFDVGEFGSSREPITVTSDSLEYDYKANVATYRGEVQAVQGKVRLRSDRLTVTLVRTGEQANHPREPGKPEVPATQGSARVREVVALGNVRIDQGTRWATGGKAIFDQGQRTLVLTDGPVLHDGPNEVAGDRVVVYLDEDRSVVEGGRKRVKAVLYPGKGDGEGGAAQPGRREAVVRP